MHDAKICNAQKDVAHLVMDVGAAGSRECFSCSTMTRCRCNYFEWRARFASSHAMEIHSMLCQERPCLLAETGSYRSVGKLKDGQAQSKSRRSTILRYLNEYDKRLITDRTTKNQML